MNKNNHTHKKDRDGIMDRIEFAVHVNKYSREINQQNSRRTKKKSHRHALALQVSYLDSWTKKLLNTKNVYMR